MTPLKRRTRWPVTASLESWMPRTDMARKMGPQVPYQTNTESVDLHCSLPEIVCAAPRLRKLPPGPFRSLGGYLDYEEWPDRERFMELDRALQHSAQERHNSGCQVDS